MNAFLPTSILIAGLILFTGCSRTPEDYLQNAKEYLAQNDRAAALVELKNAVQKNPANAEARWLLGKMYFESGDVASAKKEMQKALDAGLSMNTAAALWAQVLVATGDYDQLLALHEEALDPASRSTVQAAKGLAMLVQGKNAIAKDLIAEANSNEPRSPEAMVAAARLSMVERLNERALEQMRSLVATYPDYAPGWSMLGDIEARDGRTEEAAAAYQKAIDLSDNSFNDRLKLAIINIYEKDIDSARQELALLKKRAPNNPGISFAQGLLYLREQNIDEAKTAFQNAAMYRGGNPYAL